MKKFIHISLIVVFALRSVSFAAELPATQPSTQPDPAREQRLQWWKEAKFGMFMHWGLYAITAGYWQGKKGGAEHIMLNLKIPLADYATLAPQFNPTQFDANQWVKIAKDAGMKYIVITSKHHDGFAMFDSPSSDYNIVKKTPFARDPMKDLAAACQAQGVKLCFYYSLGRDWADPDVPTKNGYRSNTWDYPDEAKKDFSKYFERKVKPQIKELLTQYGPIGIIWFDTPEEISQAQSAELVAWIHSLQPDCIIDSRVGHNLGDYEVNEQKIPTTPLDHPWETCMTMNGSWGYVKDDNRWKPPQVLVFNLVDIVSKGGNFLLNVGPTAEGLIPQKAQEELSAVGAWMKDNSDAIYGADSTTVGQSEASKATSRSAVPENVWRCTTKPGKYYFSLFNWSRPTFDLPQIKGSIAKAYLLSDPAHATLKVEGSAIQLPEKLPDFLGNVICVEVTE